MDSLTILGKDGFDHEITWEADEYNHGPYTKPCLEIYEDGKIVKDIITYRYYYDDVINHIEKNCTLRSDIIC